MEQKDTKISTLAQAILINLLENMEIRLMDFLSSLHSLHQDYPDIIQILTTVLTSGDKNLDQCKKLFNTLDSSKNHESYSTLRQCLDIKEKKVKALNEISSLFAPLRFLMEKKDLAQPFIAWKKEELKCQSLLIQSLLVENNLLGTLIINETKMPFEWHTMPKTQACSTIGETDGRRLI